MASPKLRAEATHLGQHCYSIAQLAGSKISSRTAPRFPSRCPSADIISHIVRSYVRDVASGMMERGLPVGFQLLTQRGNEMRQYKRTFISVKMASESNIMFSNHFQAKLLYSMWGIVPETITTWMSPISALVHGRPRYCTRVD
jgi:hypothetical protein